MKDINYSLQEEDYRSYIRWSLREHPQKGKKIAAAVLFALLALILLSQTVKANGADVRRILQSSAVVLVIGVILVLGMSPKRQEQIIWRRSGLNRLKLKGFPQVHMICDDKYVRMIVPSEEMDNRFSYKDIESVSEIERLVLLKTRGAWNFVAKTAFADEAEKDDFMSFVREKIEDAAAHPENYPHPDDDPALHTAAEDVVDVHIAADDEMKKG